MKRKAAASEAVRIAVTRPESAVRERYVGFSPLAELIENDDRIEILAAVPGFEASHLEVDVLPEAIDIEGDQNAKRKLLCRLHLPCAVQARKTVARLDRGRLTVSAPK